MGHVVSVVTPQLCPCSMRTGIYNMQMNECGCFPIKLYLPKIWPISHSLLTLCPRVIIVVVVFRWFTSFFTAAEVEFHLLGQFCGMFYTMDYLLVVVLGIAKCILNFSVYLESIFSHFNENLETLLPCRSLYPPPFML